MQWGGGGGEGRGGRGEEGRGGKGGEGRGGKGRQERGEGRGEGEGKGRENKKRDHEIEWRPVEQNMYRETSNTMEACRFQERNYYYFPCFFF